jgi:excisionase family DNA binding protein
MELLTTDEVAELLRISRNQVVLMAKRGELPAVSVLGKLRFDANELEAWLKERRLRSDE